MIFLCLKKKTPECSKNFASASSITRTPPSIHEQAGIQRHSVVSGGANELASMDYWPLFGHDALERHQSATDWTDPGRVGSPLYCFVALGCFAKPAQPAFAV